MRRTRFLCPALALGLMLGAHPVVAHAQSMDRHDKPAMGAMKDTSAMKHDTMGKDAMGKDAVSHDAMAKDGMREKGAMNDTSAMKRDRTKGKTTSGSGMSDKGTMAEPTKMSHP